MAINTIKNIQIKFIQNNKLQDMIEDIINIKNLFEELPEELYKNFEDDPDIIWS